MAKKIVKSFENMRGFLIVFSAAACLTLDTKGDIEAFPSGAEWRAAHQKREGALL